MGAYARLLAAMERVRHGAALGLDGLGPFEVSMHFPSK
jgi:hypothetical protein